MSDFTVTVDSAEVHALLSRAESALRGPALRRALLAGAMVAETAVKLSITSGPKSGRTYPRGKRLHQASAPGQPPATDTGHLVNSVQTKAVNDDTAAVTVNAEYGAPLEYGTRKMAARPFLRPVADGKRDDIVQAVVDTLRAELERGA